jgi:hypothetical protein
MAADPLKRRGEAGMSIFLWSFPMDFWEDATAPVAHLGRKRLKRRGARVTSFGSLV